MKQLTTLPNYKVLNGSHLKLLAILTMLIDHTAVILSGCVPFLRTPVFGTTYTVFFLMRKVGRLALPLFCFLLTEGFVHTKSRVKYGCNLLIFALISELPYNLMHGGKLINWGAQNVFFTLFFGFLALWLLESPLRIQYKALILVPCIVFLPYLHADYSRNGVLLIILLYTFRENALLRGILSLPLLSGGVAAWCAFLPITMYNGKRGFITGKVLKYAFYAFYPLHILVLYGIKLLLTC